MNRYIIKVVILLFSILTVVNASAGNWEYGFNIKAGGGAGLSMASLYKGGEGFGLTPLYFARLDTLILGGMPHGFGLKLDLGYNQLKLPAQNGSINADYFTSALTADYRYSINNPINNIDTMTLYALTGPYMNILLSTSYTDYSTDSDYNFKDYHNIISAGIHTGVGIDLKIQRFNIFLESRFAPAITGDIKSIASKYIILNETSQYSIQFKLGVVFLIYQKNITRENTSMSLKDRTKISLKKKKIKKKREK